MSNLNSFTQQDSVDLIDWLLKNPSDFRKLGVVLEGKPPEKQAAIKLISAFNQKYCEPWLVAFVLGCIGHRIGYETVKNILLSHAGQSSERYAGAAMTKILGIAAYSDLRQVVFSDRPYKVREGAAYGLVQTCSPQLFNDLLGACKQERLSRSTVVSFLVESNPTDEWLLELVEGEDRQNQKLACVIIEKILASSTASPPGDRIAQSVAQLLNDPSLSLLSKRKKNLLAWINASNKTLA